MEVGNKLQNPLLEARESALREAESRSLRPLGKLWGMDVFTWVQPHVDDLSATLNALPFPIFWLGTEKQIHELTQLDPVGFSELQWVGQFDSAHISIDPEFLHNMPLFTATETMEESLNFLRNLRTPRNVVLFTVEGNEWKTKLSDFEAFVRINAEK